MSKQQYDQWCILLGILLFIFGFSLISSQLLPYMILLKCSIHIMSCDCKHSRSHESHRWKKSDSLMTPLVWSKLCICTLAHIWWLGISQSVTVIPGWRSLLAMWSIASVQTCCIIIHAVAAWSWKKMGIRSGDHATTAWSFMQLQHGHSCSCSMIRFFLYTPESPLIWLWHICQAP